MSWRALILTLVAIVALLQAVSSAQSMRRSPEFDVASIRPVESVSSRSHISNPAQNSEFTAVNVSLRDLMEVAYAVPETQMFGGSDWTQFQRFDVQAKSGAALDERLSALPLEQARDLKRQMLTRLLADRFRLTAHRESRIMPVYLLVPDKSGAKLQPSDSKTANLSGGESRISIKGGNDALDILAFELSWRLGRPVLNRSGLSGPYHIELTWAADDGSTGSGAPSLFTAVQEQLGLKLEPAKAPVPVVVIDRAEKPSAN